MCFGSTVQSQSMSYNTVLQDQRTGNSYLYMLGRFFLSIFKAVFAASKVEFVPISVSQAWILRMLTFWCELNSALSDLEWRSSLAASWARVTFWRCNACFALRNLEIYKNIWFEACLQPSEGCGRRWSLCTGAQLRRTGRRVLPVRLTAKRK